VTVSTARGGTGERLVFVHNWSWHAVSLEAPVAVRDLIAGGSTAAGGALELGAWDVAVLAELGDAR
jgi:hypothetical protein